jgi:feruloyl esterase
MASLLTSQGCVPDTFSSLSLFGAEILSISADPVVDFSYPVLDGWQYSQPSHAVDNSTFCNITVTYTHPNQGDTINAEVWLPLKENWNQRLQAIGGGGWVAGRFLLAYAGMAGALVDGYAAASTDAGVGDSSPVEWSLVSEGNLNFVDLDNFGQRSLGDLVSDLMRPRRSRILLYLLPPQAAIAKSVVEQYYGKPADYSYWNGCSNGGRQAAILAQQYPDAYDGIIAAAPALFWAELAISSIWPAVFMDLTNQYPRNCELNQLTSLAISKCDNIDGIEDGLISDPEMCRAIFNPWNYVGTTFHCQDTDAVLDMEISPAAASVAEAIWSGAKFSNGDFMWYGYEIGVDLSTAAGTTCNETCVPAGRSTAAFWYLEYIERDLTANVTTLSHAQFDQLYLALKKTFVGSLEASEPRITRFQEAGGKMITFHGLVSASPTSEPANFDKNMTDLARPKSDPAITPGSTLQYYK